MTDLFRIFQLRPFQKVPHAIRIPTMQRSELQNELIKFSDASNALIHIRRAASNFAETQDFIRSKQSLRFGGNLLSFFEEAKALSDPNLDSLNDLVMHHFNLTAKRVVVNNNFVRDRRNMADTIIALAINPDLDKFGVFCWIVDAFRTTYLLQMIADESVTLNNASTLSYLANAQVILPSPPFPLIKFMPTSGEDIQLSTLLDFAGIGDVFVIREDLVEYELGEITHIENVLRSEVREREHTRTRTTEETFFTEMETTKEEEKDLQTTERYELTTETSNTIKEDSSLELGATLNASYGKFVEFTGTTNYASSTAQEESVSNSSSYARDIVNRSVNKITERIKKQQSYKVVETYTERNLHKFDNTNSNSNIAGIYQALNKRLKAKQFNIGSRHIFDFIIPEPGVYLKYLNERSTLELPKPPEPPNLKPNPENNSSNDYFREAAKFGVTVESTAPAKYIFVSGNIKKSLQPGSSKDALQTIEDSVLVSIPSGYVAKHIYYNILCGRDDVLISRGEGSQDGVYLSVNIGAKKVLEEIINEWAYGSDKEGDEYGPEYPGEDKEKRRLVWSKEDNQPIEKFVTGEKELAFSVESDEGQKGILLSLSGFSNHIKVSINVNIIVKCKRRISYFNKWKTNVHTEINKVFYAQLNKYNEEVERIKIQESYKDGERNPLDNRQREKEELKKFAIEMLTNQHFDLFGAIDEKDVKNHTVLQPNLSKAIDQGSIIRFFEQAFEWHYMMYLLYPYFWSRKEEWESKLNLKGSDLQHDWFLKAGAARVVLPVRPGFEAAMQFYLDTGRIWNGSCKVPDVGSEMYIEITEEIKEQQALNNLDDSIAVSEWDVILPTNLILLKENSELPSWEEND